MTLKYHEPGIYFGMDETEYHADPSFSASGAKKILISPLDYWVNSSLNPNYVDEKTKAMAAGTARHRRLVEPERFAAMYATMPSIEDFPDAIDGKEALVAKCKEYGLAGISKLRVEELCQALKDVDPTLQLWPLIKRDLADALGGRIIISAEAMADIERTARYVQKHKDAKKAIQGGFGEVSIFWVCERSGIRMKCRVDYLKPAATVDIKSFSNILGKDLLKAIADTIPNNRYHVQAVIYHDGVQAARKMLIEQKSAALHVAEGWNVPDEWLLKFVQAGTSTFYFLFVEQGPVTNVALRGFRERDEQGGNGSTANAYWLSGVMGYELAQRRFRESMDYWGPDEEWQEEIPTRDFQDTDFPIWMFDGVPQR